MIEAIIDRSITMHHTDISFDNTLIFETLLKIRNCNSIFELLEHESHKILESERLLLSQQLI